MKLSQFHLLENLVSKETLCSIDSIMFIPAMPRAIYMKSENSNFLNGKNTLRFSNSSIQLLGKNYRSSSDWGELEIKNNNGYYDKKNL